MRSHPLELSLAEIRHRLANSFQLILALIDQQKRRSKSDEAREILSWLSETVSAIGLLQQRLADLGSFHDYLHDAVVFWNRMGSAQGIRVELIIEEPATVPAAPSTALALAVHELVTNAIEHAFPAQQVDPKIVIELRQVGDQLELMVRDTGQGLDPARLNNGSLGLVLVKKLTRQVKGSFEIGSGAHGTTACIRLPARGA